MAKTLHSGDKVSWNTSQGETQGEVVRKQIRQTKIKGHKVAASKDHPEYIVKTSKTGKVAAHRAQSLHKR